jgi:hypothetical protein
MFETKNDLPLGSTRTWVVKLLNERLAQAIDLWFLEAHLHARR